MNRKVWSLHIIIRYALLQLPGILALVVLLVLSQSIQAISSRIVLIILILWVAKDIALYPFVWKAYEPKHHNDPHPMVGLVAVTQERLDPSGYVQVRGELWRARLEDNSSIGKNEYVKITDMQGLTLTVEPIHPKEQNES
jgi:membrane-bound ClpP family serine protease